MHVDGSGSNVLWRGPTIPRNVAALRDPARVAAVRRYEILDAPTDGGVRRVRRRCGRDVRHPDRHGQQLESQVLDLLWAAPTPLTPIQIRSALAGGLAYNTVHTEFKAGPVRLPGSGPSSRAG